MARTTTTRRRKPVRKITGKKPAPLGRGKSRGAIAFAALELADRSPPAYFGAGRPRALVLNETNAKVLAGLGRIHATMEECAAFFHVSARVFLEFLDREPEAREILTSAKGEGKVSLRRAQFQRAMDGSDTMQIWLGKQWLGQADKIEHGGEGLNVTFNIMGLPQPGQPNKGDDQGETATPARPARPRAIDGQGIRIPDPSASL